MKVITIEQAKKTKFSDLAIALGTFDGLHIGHIALLEAAMRLGGESAAFTFNTLPSDLLLTDNKPMRLFTLDEKIEAFGATGIDYLCIASFDKRFASIDKDAFALMILNTFKPKNIVAGYNYTYGRHALGNVDTLKIFCETRGCSVKVISPVIYDDEPVSSSRIRECIAAGAVERANALLGYSYSVSGTVERGAGLGNKLGFPTANITAAKEKALPLRGVYSVEVAVDGRRYKGVCNIGVKPTVSKGMAETVEAHILSLSEDIYGKKITIMFKKRLRDEMKFKGKAELIEQIKRDIENI